MSTYITNVREGKLPSGDDSSIGTSAWPNLQTALYRSVNGGTTFSSGMISTYSLVKTTSAAYFGGILAFNGDIHFVPQSANVGQKVDVNGVVSTYSLAYTTTSAYAGGVLAPNGDIHFVPSSGAMGQKVSVIGTVSTYSLTYTVAAAYAGGVLTSTGDIHFMPYSAARGQKVITIPCVPFSAGMCLSPFMNRF